MLKRAVLLMPLLLTACDAGSPVDPDGGGGGGGGGGSSPQVSTITVSPDLEKLEVGETVQLTATARGTGGGVLSGTTFQWESSRTDVATVDGSGRVTAVGAGVATIRARAGGVSGTAAVDVALPLSQVEFTTPSTLFISEWGTHTSRGQWNAWGFSVTGSATLVFRMVAQYQVEAVIIAASQLERFKNNQSYEAYARFYQQFGTISATVPTGEYYVVVRNLVDTANRYRVELDKDIQLESEQGYDFSFHDVYVNGAEMLGENGGTLWQGFTIQEGVRYLLDGANIGLGVWIIPASELSNFRNGNTFQYYSDYGGEDGAFPGLWELKLAPGSYYMVARNDEDIDNPLTYTMERWTVERSAPATLVRAEGPYGSWVGAPAADVVRSAPTP